MADPMSTDLEKSTGLATTSSLPADSDHTHHHHHHYLPNLHARSRLRHFLHPSGKRIHIADSPHEAASLHRRLFDSSSSAEPFQICISGSPEHLSAVRETQSHHQARQEELKGRHGEVWGLFEEVKGELDALSRELGRVTEKGVGVSLEGHFGKFGYDARIRSYDDDDDEEPGGGMRSGASSVKEDEGKAEPLVLFKVPVVRQYFHKGILWRASTSEEVRSFELFVDLLYVGIIAINGDATAEHPTGYSLLKFVITFTLSWKIWNDMAIIIAWFETDDVLQRSSILFLLACLFGYTTNIAEAFDHTYATLIGFYLTARLYMTAYLMLVAWLVPMVRSPMLYYTFVSLISTSLWIASIHVSYPNQLALIFLALFLDITGQASYITVLSFIGRLIPNLKNWANTALDFHPALNIEHRVERTNAFVSLVFGYTVVAILYQSAEPGIDAIFGKAILALIQPFAYNWLYFELDGANLSSHAIRRAKVTAMSWSVAHLPFIMSFVLGGGGLARLVVATDVHGAHREMLTETYRPRSEEEIAQGIRWFYCAGFGSALMFMCLISLSHVHKDQEGARLRKRFRLSIRAATAIVMICLPLAGERLDSLGLVATVTGLVVFTLMVEVWGVSRKGSGFVVGSGPCGYVGSCDRRDLRNVLEKGGEVDVDELGEKSGLKGSGVGSAAM